MVEVNEGVLGPEALAELLARNHLAGVLEKDFEHLTGLGLQLEPVTLFAQFAGVQISLKHTEPEETSLSQVVGTGGCRHEYLLNTAADFSAL
jgi:hypothetical protein